MEIINNKWVVDICNELNLVVFEGEDVPLSERLAPNDYKSVCHFIYEIVIEDTEVFNHLSLKGLINRGFCPITGETSLLASPSIIAGKSFFLSQAGKNIIDEYEKLNFLSQVREISHNLIDEQNQKSREMFMGKLTLIAISLLLILFIIKKC